jgi:hypothetical protein
MIWSSPSIHFWCKSNCNSDYVMWRRYCHNIWYGHHQTSFFGVNPTVTVIMSSGDYIVIIYDMVIFSESSVVMVTVSSGNYILVIDIWYNLRLTILNNLFVWFVCISGYYNLTTYSHSAVFQQRGAVIRRDAFLSWIFTLMMLMVLMTQHQEWWFCSQNLNKDLPWKWRTRWRVDPFWML